MGRNLLILLVCAVGARAMAFPPGLTSSEDGTAAPGSTCASVPPSDQHACVDAWAQMVQDLDCNGLPGCSCASRPPATQDACIDEWVLKKQQQANPGLVGGCAGVAPEYKQACINSWIIDQQEKVSLSPTLVPPGRSCASRPPADQQACVNNWVNQQMNLAGQGAPGSTCSSRPPADQQACINAWVIEQQGKEPLGNVPGHTCASVGPDYQQACVNSWVFKQQEKATPDPIFGSMALPYGRTCDSLPPQNVQQCVNTWINLQMILANGLKPGSTCASVSPELRQACLNSWMINYQKTRTNGAIGGCGGVAPANQQACINSYVFQLQRGSVNIITRTCQNMVAMGMKQECTKAFLMHNMMLDNVGFQKCEPWDSCADNADNVAYANSWGLHQQQLLINTGVKLGTPDCSKVEAGTAQEQCILAFVVALQKLLNHRRPELGPGGTCSSRHGREQQWACAVDFVNARMNEEGPAGMVGKDCASRGPAVEDQCVIGWVSSKQAARNPGLFGATCISLPPTQQKACVVAWVSRQQRIPFPGVQVSDGGAAVAKLCCVASAAPGSTCASYPPADQQACINAWMFEKQGQHCGWIPGCSCASVAPSEQQSCLNSWAEKEQSNGAPGGCAGVAPEYEQACVNSWVVEQQQKDQTSVPGATCATVNPANKQECINNWVNGQMFAAAHGAPGSTCSSRPPATQQDCVNDWVVTKWKESHADPIAANVCDALAGAAKQACINELAIKLQEAGA